MLAAVSGIYTYHCRRSRTGITRRKITIPVVNKLGADNPVREHEALHGGNETSIRPARVGDVATQNRAQRDGFTYRRNQVQAVGS